jgi:hypothetical protein
VTGKEDDGKAALTAEAGLKDASDRSIKGTANPARLDQVRRLANEFGAFTRILPLPPISRRSIAAPRKPAPHRRIC